mgnify:CR=1 FL=1
MTVYIKKSKANNSTKDNEFRKEKFAYNSEDDTYICPAGERLVFFVKHIKKWNEIQEI